MDKNDNSHPDETPNIYKSKRKYMKKRGMDELFINIYMHKLHIEPGYRQYYECDYCWEIEQKIIEGQKRVKQ